MNLFEVLKDGVEIPVWDHQSLLSGSRFHKATYCDFSSMMVCKFLPRMQSRFRSAHRRQGGPASSMRHFIWARAQCQFVMFPPSIVRGTTQGTYLLPATHGTCLDLARQLWEWVVVGNEAVSICAETDVAVGIAASIGVCCAHISVEVSFSCLGTTAVGVARAAGAPYKHLHSGGDRAKCWGVANAAAASPEASPTASRSVSGSVVVGRRLDRM